MESVELKRQDLIHTSSGKCHKYVPPLSFPDGNFRRTIFDPLPPPLVGEKQVKREETFITSTGVAHDNKWSQNPYKNELYKKAPGHWNQQIYVKDLREKLMHRPHRATLTVRGNGRGWESCVHLWNQFVDDIPDIGRMKW